ncbi:polypeptide N-acetylgalactosaminyltransferase 3 [Patella vulgata]|uniref:polypeptide N-acetylgalactosaminyltransferase 3 n=1 Tax=Patella vulgata TaxID=6465 RepID=UPI00217FE4B7|nr:polypeptide N-acetylgalactosaminyltransferase 3 [Patella vulgata]
MFKMSRLIKRHMLSFLALAVVAFIGIKMWTTVSSSSNSSNGLSPRLAKAYFSEEEEEKDPGTFSENWPDVHVLEGKVRRYLKENSNSSSGYFFPWTHSLKSHREQFCDETYRENMSFSSSSPVAIIVGASDSSLLQIFSCVTFLLRNTPKELVHNLFVVADKRLSENDFDILEDHLLPVPFFRTFHLSNYTDDLPARAFAAEFTSATTYVFLDAKVIVEEGWLEPLISEVTKNYTTVAVPLPIPSTVNSRQNLTWYSMRRREIDWDLNLRWGLGTSVSDHSGRLTTQPAIYEHLFVVSARYFKEIGGFDYLRKGSGAEAVLWSIKTWLCHGQILRSSCSKVIEFQEPKQRKRQQYFSERESTLRYKAYVAQTFLSNSYKYYKCLIHNSLPHTRPISFYYTKALKTYSNILKCNTFSAFLTRAQTDLKPPPKQSEHYGRLKLSSAEVYVSVDKNNQLVLVSDETHIANDFSFYNYALMYKGLCLYSSNNHDLVLVKCDSVYTTKVWQFQNGMIRNKSDQRYCISRVPNRGIKLGHVFLVSCSKPNQYNTFEFSLSFKKRCLH